MYSSLPFPEPFQNRFTLVTTASFNLDKRFAARRIICGLPPLTALSGNIFLILMSFAFLFHAEALRTPARASLRDSLSLGGYPRALPRAGPCGRRCRACGTFPSSHRSSAHLPTTTTSSDYCSRLRYWQFSQVPLQNFRDAPPPLPRRAHLAQIESARRCWFHEHRSADHAETFNETLCRKFTCVTARLFVRQDSRTSVALCTACRPNRMSISLRYSSFRY